MTLAEERDEAAGRTPPQDPAPVFNSTAAPAESIQEQVERHRKEDAMSSQQEKFKSSVQRTNDMLEKLKEMNDKSAQQSLEGMQKSLSVAGQVITGLASHPKAQQALKPVAMILGAMQNISGMLVSSYMQGTSEKDMQAKINQGLIDTRAEMNKIGQALEQRGDIKISDLVTPKQLADAGYTPADRTPAERAPAVPV